MHVTSCWFYPALAESFWKPLGKPYPKFYDINAQSSTLCIRAACLGFNVAMELGRCLHKAFQCAHPSQQDRVNSLDCSYDAVCRDRHYRHQKTILSSQAGIYRCEFGETPSERKQASTADQQGNFVSSRSSNTARCRDVHPTVAARESRRILGDRPNLDEDMGKG